MSCIVFWPNRYFLQVVVLNLYYLSVKFSLSRKVCLYRKYAIYFNLFSDDPNTTEWVQPLGKMILKFELV